MGLTRDDALVLGGICALALTIQVSCALTWHLGYDEVWHIFASMVRPFEQFVVEVQREAHPPLSYLGLRLLGRLGDSVLWPRLLSILPGLGTIVLMVLCARAMGVSRPIVWLTGLGLAIAPVPTNMAVVVRAYSLATMWTLVAYFCYLRVLADPVRVSRRYTLGFAIAAVLAMWSEYNAALSVAAVLATVAGLGLWRRGFLRAIWEGQGETPRWPEVLILAEGLVLLVAYRDWAAAPAYAHLEDLFPAPGRSTLEFAVDGILNTLRLLTTLTLHTWESAILFLALGLIALGWLGGRYLAPWSARRDLLRGVTILVQVELWAMLFVLACLRLYPFGGHLRHQYLLFPFLVFIGVFLADVLYRRCATRLAQVVVCLALGGLMGLGSLRGFANGPVEEFPGEPMAADAAAVWAGIQDGDVIYTSQFGQVVIFANMRDWRWIYRETFDDRVDVFSVTTAGSRVEVLRDRRLWAVPSPPDESAVAKLAVLVRARRYAAVWVFAIHPKAINRTHGRGAEDAALAQLVGQEGLVVDRRLVFDWGEVLRVARS